MLSSGLFIRGLIKKVRLLIIIRQREAGEISIFDLNNF